MRHDFTVKRGLVGFKLFDNNQSGNIVAHTVGERAEEMLQMIIDELHREGHSVDMSALLDE